LAYFIFKHESSAIFRRLIYAPNFLSYFVTFFAGALFSLSFSVVPAAALLLVLSHEQIFLLSGLVASTGAMVSDMLVFQFSRKNFSNKSQEELKAEASQSKIFIYIDRLSSHLSKKYSQRFETAITLFVASLIIITPLPNELGIALASTTKLSLKQFFILSYVFNIFGVFILLLIGKIL
jgi:uncharacterized membrane protein YdjX (TVP38/TMEM64 family)